MILRVRVRLFFGLVYVRLEWSGWGSEFQIGLGERGCNFSYKESKICCFKASSFCCENYGMSRDIDAYSHFLPNRPFFHHYTYEMISSPHILVKIYLRRRFEFYLGISLMFIAGIG